VESWLEKSVDGRIYGYVNPCGAITGRMTHSDPNVGQVPSKGRGKRLRECWRAKEGYKLVGCDADGLELRCLAHYMQDDAYSKAVCFGKKEDGSDAHTKNKIAAGLADRDTAKTFIYAFLYGAGGGKIAAIADLNSDEAGNALKQKFLRRTPALKALIARVKKAARKGYLVAIDGRKVYVRALYAALNTLLQSAGAILMKQALVLLDEAATKEGLDYEFVGNIHDEFQTEVLEKDAPRFAELAEWSIKRAGEVLGFRVPMAGSAAIGDCWAETH